MASVAWFGMATPQHPQSTAVVGPVTTQKLWYPELMKELYLRAAKVKDAAIADLTSERCVPATTSLRWRLSVQVADEVSIFLLSLAIAIGLATAISDFAEMSKEAQEEKSVGAAVEHPEAEKIHKPSSSSSQWRLMACIALLLAVAAGFVASMGEDM